MGWEHYETVDPPPPPPNKKKIKTQVGSGLFVVYLLILHFKFQVSKSIKSSTSHVFGCFFRNNRNLHKGFLKRLHLFREIIMSLKTENINTSNQFTIRWDSTPKRKASRHFLNTHLQCLTLSPRQKVLLKKRALWRMLPCQNSIGCKHAIFSSCAL